MSSSYEPNEHLGPRVLVIAEMLDRTVIEVRRLLDEINETRAKDPFTEDQRDDDPVANVQQGAEEDGDGPAQR